MMEHPGQYIKRELIPQGVTIREAAEQLGFGRPTLTNVLNGKAPLSKQLAERIEKVFGGNSSELLKMQIDYDDKNDVKIKIEPLVPYVPPHLEILAREITAWANRVDSRARLAVFIRKLIHSTALELSKVEFSGNDQSQRHGWDGLTLASSATPWVPLGKAGWEFGVNQDPKTKADSDYDARVGAIAQSERSETTFIFVTPRTWAGKEKWVTEKKSLSDWKDVRAYDASNLEEWLEQSIATQIWFASENGRDPEGAISLEEVWERWVADSSPRIIPELFTEAVEHHLSTLKGWIDKPASSLTIQADSTIEALAYLAAANTILQERDWHSDWAKKYEKMVVIENSKCAKKILTENSQLIPVLISDQIQQVFAPFAHSHPHVVIQLRGQISQDVDIRLEPVTSIGFSKALEKMKIESEDADRLARESGRSLTILRRRLSKLPGVKSPSWSDTGKTRILLGITLSGCWHRRNESDKTLVSMLCDADYAEVDAELKKLQLLEDSPVWAVGSYQGIKSQIDAFYALAPFITDDIIKLLFDVSEIVLGEDDPSLDLAEDQRWMASFHGKTREFSSSLRTSLRQMVLILAVFGDEVLSDRADCRVEWLAKGFVKKLLDNLSVRTLKAIGDDLPTLAEMSPETFIEIIETDLAKGDKSVCLAILEPVSSEMGARCDRTGLLWALELLAWNENYLDRVVSILATLSSKEINDNWSNKPIETLSSIFRFWFPQTAANIELRMAAFTRLWENSYDVAWTVAIEQVDQRGMGSAMANHKPDWRDDARRATYAPGNEKRLFIKHCLDLVLDRSVYTQDEIVDLLSLANGWPNEDQTKLWAIVQNWGIDAPDSGKAKVRECIRQMAYSRRAASRARRQKSDEFDPVEVANAYDALEPVDLIQRHHWLFHKQWIEAGIQDLDEYDYEKVESKTLELRRAALSEIFDQLSITGVLELSELSEASWVIGDTLGKVISVEELVDASVTVFKSDDKQTNNTENLLAGMLGSFPAEELNAVLKTIWDRLPDDQHLRFLKVAPFLKDVWDLAEELPVGSDEYWKQVHIRYIRNDDEQVIAAKRLLNAKRPISSLNVLWRDVSKAPEGLLLQILEQIAFGESVKGELSGMQRHRVVEVFEYLNNVGNVDTKQVLKLEFAFLRLLEGSKYGLPNLEKEIEVNPQLYVDAMIYLYKRKDGLEDPEQYQLESDLKKSHAENMYHFLKKLKRIPGQDEETTEKSSKKLIEWINTVQKSAEKYSRKGPAESNIGELLARSSEGEDGVWPNEFVRNALEQTITPRMSEGFRVGKYNQRGAHFRDRGGRQERALEKQYRDWSSSLKVKHPKVSRVLGQIADTYEREASTYDIEERVARRRVR